MTGYRVAQLQAMLTLSAAFIPLAAGAPLLVQQPTFPLALNGHNDLVLTVVFSPDGKMLASGSQDHTIKLWDVRTGKNAKTIGGIGRARENSVMCLAYSPDGRTIASGGNDGVVRLWEGSSAKARAELATHAGVVTCVAYTPDGKTLVASCVDQTGEPNGSNTVVVWDVDSRSIKTLLRADPRGTYAVAISPDGTTLASGGFESLKLWDLKTAKNTASVIAKGGLIRSLAFSSDGKTLASGASGRSEWPIPKPGKPWQPQPILKLWDVRAREHLATLPMKTSIVSCVAFSPDGKTLASGGTGVAIWLWDVSTRKNTAIVRAPKERDSLSVGSVAYSPDGKLLAAACGRNIVVWDVQTAR